MLKHINPFCCLVAVVIGLSLSGCTSTPSETQVNEHYSLGETSGVNQDVVNTTDKDTGEVSQDAHLAQQLRSSENYYTATKRVFSEKEAARFNLALDHFGDGEFDKATQIAEELIEADPTATPSPQPSSSPSAVWVLLGDIARALDDNNLAIAHYTQAVDRNQYNYYALNRLGTLARENGEFQQAQQFYLNAIKAWPGYQNAHYNLGILLDLYVGDKASALEYYGNYYALLRYPDNQASQQVDMRLVKQVERWIADVNRQIPATARGSSDE